MRTCGDPTSISFISEKVEHIVKNLNIVDVSEKVKLVNPEEEKKLIFITNPANFGVGGSGANTLSVATLGSGSNTNSNNNNNNNSFSINNSALNEIQEVYDSEEEVNMVQAKHQRDDRIEQKQ